MPRRGTSKPSLRSRTAGKKRPSPSSCKHLIHVDSGPVRDKTRRDYDKVRGDLAKTQSELDRFQQHDLPQYQLWINSRFGRLLTQLRELRTQIGEADRLIIEVEAEVFYSGCSYQQAYRRVLREQEEAEAPDTHSETSDSDSRPGSGPEPDEPEETYEQDFFHEFFSGKATPKPPKNEPPPAPRLKSLYRALVRLLHPDKNSELTPEQKERWHEAQAAYQKGDEAQLELILTLCELDHKNHDTRHASVSLLQRIVKQLKSSLRQLRKKLRDCKANFAWGFSLNKNRELLHHQFQRLLEEDLYRAREALAERQALVNRWKRSSRPRRPQSKHNRRRAGAA